MDLITLHIFICLILVFFFLAIPPSVRRRYNKYNEFEKIKDISKKYNIMKPGYLMFNLDHHDEGSRFYKWISGRSEKIPRNTDDPILFIKESIASIENNEEKKIYARWLINQLSERGGKNSDRKDDYAKLKNTVHKIHDNIGNSNFNIEEEKNSRKVKIEDIIRQVAKSTSSNGNSKIENPKTIELYLKNLVENPLAGVETIQDNLDQSGALSKPDADIFPDLNFGTLRGWEKKFFKILEDHCYGKYAQRFSRFNSSQ